MLIPCYNDMDDGTHQLFVPLSGGVGLGIYHKDTAIFEFKTFVDNSLLKESQRQDVVDISHDVLNQLMEAMKSGNLPKRTIY